MLYYACVLSFMACFHVLKQHADAMRMVQCILRTPITSESESGYDDRPDDSRRLSDKNGLTFTCQKYPKQARR